MKRVLQEKRKIQQEIRRKKNIGLSEMHNIFVAADEEKRMIIRRKLAKKFAC